MAKLKFNPSAVNFDGTNAVALAQAALLAYESGTLIVREVRETWGFLHCKFIDEADTQCFVAADETTLLLAFRGTESSDMDDWLTDLKIRHVAGPFGRVHAGFQAAWQSIGSKVIETLREFSGPGQTIWITGHSLGGALAVLAAASLIKEAIPVAGLYTFGQPRVGDLAFAKKIDESLNRKIFRFVNNQDIVTRVPPRLGGYSHRGICYFFDGRGKLHKGIRGWEKFLRTAEATARDALTRFGFLNMLWPDWVEDHSMSRYLKNLRKNV